MYEYPSVPVAVRCAQTSLPEMITWLARVGVKVSGDAARETIIAQLENHLDAIPASLSAPINYSTAKCMWLPIHRKHHAVLRSAVQGGHIVFTDPSGIFVSGLPKDLTRAELKTAFGRYGTMIYVRFFPYHKRKLETARIVYKCPASAQRAIEAENGTKWKGAILAVTHRTVRQTEVMWVPMGVDANGRVHRPTDGAPFPHEYDFPSHPGPVPKITLLPSDQEEPEEGEIDEMLESTA